jgi:fructosamine-3-kinase
MISGSLKDRLKAFITKNTGLSISSFDLSAVGGGSINQTWKISINQKEKFFCKINSASRFPSMFEKEKKGLELLASQKVIRVPYVLGTFKEDDYQVLVLEWIEQGARSDNFWTLFAEQLAALHSIHSAYAGLDEDNYMGALSQSNHLSSDWISFFINQRLEPQVKLAIDKRLLQLRHHKQFERLYKELPEIFPTGDLCLLHGDLWSGNFLCDHSGMPVLIDPATYFGHPAIDLGMTTLFGGFDPVFYNSYNRQSPFPSNHLKQWEICNLYPLLIHLNLFGKGYLQSIISTIQYY